MAKRSKRSMTKYPNLDPNLNLKSRQDLIDFDYIDKLSEQEKKWLDQFVDEEVNANFKKYRRRILPKKEITIELRSGKKKKRDVYKYESYKRNNERNADMFTRAKSSGMMHNIDDVNLKQTNVEDKLIKSIDRNLRKKRK